MNEMLDLTELLKDCPKGTKFYSSYLGRDVFFIGIHNNYIECEYPSKIDSPFNSTIQFRKEGSFFKEGECMLFPSKDQRDWSKWHRLFKDGDVITCTNSACSFVAIFKEMNTDMTFNRYVSLTLDDKQQFCTKEGWADFKNPRFATKEEKQLLFDAIKAHGYRWNAKTKTLEKLTEPKFKVGDRIKHRLTGDVYKVLFVLSNECDGGVYDVAITDKIGKSIAVEEQDNYELVPNKFDITVLKPFDNCKYSLDKGRTWKFAQYWYIQDNYIVTDIEIELWQD